jgi:hypothetical protein
MSERFKVVKAACAVARAECALEGSRSLKDPLPAALK